MNPMTNVAFLTSYRDYSFDAWETGACGFLLKPLTQEAVSHQLSVLRFRHEKTPEQTAKDTADITAGAVTEAEQADAEAAAPAEKAAEEAAEVSEETIKAAKEALQARTEETTGRRRRSKS